MGFSLPKRPKQNFWNKVVDQFSANTEADQYRRDTANYQRQLSGKGNTPKSTAVAKPLVEGWKRSIAGLGESASGLVDLVTPGKGTSQITKNFRVSGQLSDIEARDKNYNTGLYKAGQAGGEAAQMLATAGASKLPAATKATNYLDKTSKVLRGGNLASRSAGFVVKPQVLTNVISNTAQSSGLRTARDIKNTPQAVLTDAAVSVAIPAAVPVVAAGVKNGAKAVVKMGDNASTTTTKARVKVKPVTSVSDTIKKDPQYKDFDKRAYIASENMSNSKGKLKANYRQEANELIRLRNARAKELSQGGFIGSGDVPQVGKTDFNGFTDNTDTWDIDRILKNEEIVGNNQKVADYYREAKGEDWHIEEMTPDEYLKRAEKVMGNDSSKAGQYHSGNVEKYAEDMRKGDKFAMPWLNEVRGTQEGRTRALAAKANGQKTIRVAVASKYDSESYASRLKYEKDAAHNQKMLDILNGKTKPSVKLKESANISRENIPPVEPPTPPIKKVDVDPNDPFGNRNIIKQVRNEMGSLVDEDAKMINLLRKIEKETGKEGLVDQWYFDSGNVKQSNSIANSRIKRSESVSQAFGGLSKKESKEFDDYVGARAELNNYEGMKTSKTPEQLQAIVGLGDAKYGQRFEALNSYYKEMAQELKDAGLIDQKTLDEWNTNSDYVRIQRNMDELVNPGMSKSQGRSIATTTTKQKRKGSERELLSPSQSMLKRTQQLQLEIQRNKAASNTIDILEEQGLAKKVDKATNRNTISRIVDGKTQHYEVSGDVKEVMDNVNPYHLGVLSTIVSTPVRLLRAGTTALSVPFTAVNYMRDQVSSAITSKDVLSTHAPNNIIRGLWEAGKDGFAESNHPLWKKFEEFAGDSTIYDELRNAKNSTKVLREVRRGQKGKVYNAVTSPIRTLEDFNSITEKATRFQNFKGIYEQAIKDGLSDADATQKAVLASRQNSVDFNRSSPFTRTANLFIPYFNAGVQGSRTVARAFKERPVATSMKSVGLVALPAMAATMYNLSDENRRKAYESINEFEKNDNFIIVGPDAKQQEDGSWTGIIKIPKPQGYRELTQPVQDITEKYMQAQNTKDVGSMLQDMLGALSGPIETGSVEGFLGSITPQQVKPTVQQMVNKDLYTGSDIVPDYMIEQTDDPTKRARENTSGSARLIANALGISPIQVEKMTKDYAGSLGLYTMNAADNALFKAGKIPEEQIGGRSALGDVKRRLVEATGELLPENKSSGQKYYENVKQATEGFNKNDKSAWDTIHPVKTNFLGEDIFDENKRISKYTRAGVYLNNPNVLEADRKLNEEMAKQGNPSNPLFDLPTPLLTKVLLKDALPPGAKDEELSNLYDQEWYQDYKNAQSKYYDEVKASMEAQGKSFPTQKNPYPETPPQLQGVMDEYSALPKGTGARSSWIKANPGLWQQMTAQWQQVDAWENNERVAMGLSPIVAEDSSTSGYGNSGSGSGSDNIINAGAYIRKPSVGNLEVASTSQSSLPKVKRRTAKIAKPTVSIKKSNI